MKTQPNKNIYLQVQRFANVTKELIIQGNIIKAKRCLEIAEDIFNNGTSEIKNAVTNVYVFSVSTFMELHNCNIKKLFPAALQSEYYKQVYTAGM